MDEKTLNDLLECSVCLERLDTSSKVLPCQHTFCRKCLEVIVQSHQELRCPECRVLVDSKIDELPPNVLLMRILEGMKNASHTQQILSTQAAPIMTKSPKNLANLQQNIISGVVGVVGSGQIMGGGYNYNLANNSKLITSNNIIRNIGIGHDHLLRNNYTNKQLIPHAKALYDFSSKEPGDLNFKIGDIIIMRKIIDHNWCFGELNGREGAFPINHVEIITPLPLPQSKALYDFRMGPNEEEGCLTFKKGAVIQVIRRVDPNWAEGRIGEAIGIFPIAFVEMNTSARQLMDASAKHVQHNSSRAVPPKPFETVISSDSSSTTTSPNSSSTSNTSSNSSTAPSSPTSNLNATSTQVQQVPQQIGQLRDNKEKRHSLTALIANNHSNPITSNNRHSVEILNPVISNQPAQIQQTKHLQNSSENIISSPSNIAKTSTTQQQRAKLVHQRFPNFPVVCEAIYPYKPQNTDELELKKGSIYYVIERCEDGWLKGSNRSKKTGVFPGNYVVPITRSRENSMPQSTPRIETNSGPSSVPGLINCHKTGNLPPELPPRNNSPSGLQSIWSKSAAQGHVDALFNRKSSQTTSNNQIKNEKGNSSHTKSEITSSTTTTSAPASVAKDKKESSTASSAVSLMKRLTNIKRSKSPTNQATFSMDNPVFEDTPSTAITPGTTSKHAVQIAHPVHVRSGSCPSQLLHNLPHDINTSNGESSGSFLFGSKRVKPHKERPSLQELRSNTEPQTNSTKVKTIAENIPGPSSVVKQQPCSASNVTPQAAPQQTSKIPSAYHRKSQSLDATTISTQINGTPSKSKSHSHVRERFRCIVPYPPNSEYELELHVGDIVFVHKKRENGWYKGTHQRTGKAGLFPASFVEPDI